MKNKKQNRDRTNKGEKVYQIKGTFQEVWKEYMKLKAFARERITNGDELPMDKFGVFVGSKTKLTKK